MVSDFCRIYWTLPFKTETTSLAACHLTHVQQLLYALCTTVSFNFDEMIKLYHVRIQFLLLVIRPATCSRTLVSKASSPSVTPRSRAIAFNGSAVSYVRDHLQRHLGKQ